MHGYDSRNMSIDLPPVEIMPPVLKGHRDKDGILHYTVTGLNIKSCSFLALEKFLLPRFS